MPDWKGTIRKLEGKLFDLKREYRDLFLNQGVLRDTIDRQLRDFLNSDRQMEETLKEADNFLKLLTNFNAEYEHDQKEARDIEKAMKELKEERDEAETELKANKDDKELKKQFEIKDKAYEKQTFYAKAKLENIESKEKNLTNAEKDFEEFFASEFHKSLGKLNKLLKTIVDDVKSVGDFDFKGEAAKVAEMRKEFESLRRK